MQNWIELVELAGVDDHDIAGGLVEYNWDELVERLSAHERRAHKHGPCFLPISMKPQAQWRLSGTQSNNPTFRNAENVKAITLAVIDMDQPGAFDLARLRFAAYDHVAYTTHSYSEKEPWKWRMVIRLDEPIDALEWKPLYSGLIDGLGADPSCCHPAALFYLPSHNPTSGVPAKVEVNRGRALTKAEIADMAPDRQARGQVTATLRRLGVNGVVSEDRRRRSDLDYTWDAFCQRHGAAIAELSKTNSRHSFALRVIATELSAAGNQFNLAWTVEFIAMAAKSYSNKALHEGQNTPDEIPSMVISAAEKFAPEWLSQHKSLAAVKRTIEGVVKGVVARSRAGKNSLYEAAVAKPTATAYWWKRHDSACRTLLDDGDLAAFGHSVFRHELHLAGDKTDLNRCAEFVFYAARRYLVRQGVTSANDLAAAMHKLTADMTAAVPNNMPWPRGPVWYRSAVLLGEASMTKKRRFTLQMSSKAEQDLAP